MGRAPAPLLPAGETVAPSTGSYARLLAFVLRRVLQSSAVMAVVAFIAFSLFNFTGDPVAFMVTQQATFEEKEQLRAELGLDRPYYIQFARFVGNAGRGDFGIPLGVYTALKRDTWLAQVLLAASLVGVSLLGAIIAFAIITETVFQWRGWARCSSRR